MGKDRFVEILKEYNFSNENIEELWGNKDARSDFDITEKRLRESVMVIAPYIKERRRLRKVTHSSMILITFVWIVGALIAYAGKGTLSTLVGFSGAIIISILILQKQKRNM